jgi:aspartyl-tRNA(Asn)/glutamyl-tRNA(Gln) amidotransferase subunit C
MRMTKTVKLTKKQVQHVAELSNLTLTDQEVNKFSPQLSKIVDFIGQLSEVDTEGVEPTNQTTGLSNVYREDVVNPVNILSVAKATSGTENVHNDLFKVPAILTGRTDK